MSESAAIKAIVEALTILREVEETARNTQQLQTAIVSIETGLLWLREHHRTIQVPPFRVVGGT